jgi:hypothetical protein
MFDFRIAEMARQGDNWAGVAVESRADALVRIGGRLGRDYSGSGQLASWLDGADLALGIAGLLVLAGLALTTSADRRHAVVLAILSGQAGLIVVGLRSDYARYSLPIVLVLVFGASIVAGCSWAAIADLRRRHHLRRWRERLASAVAYPPLAWMLGGASVVALILTGAGTAAQDDLPEIVPWVATPGAATPLGGGTPLAATPGATPLSDLAATPVTGTPVASGAPAAAP